MTGSLWRLLLRALTSPSGRLGAIIVALLTLFVFIALCGLAFRLLRPLIDRLGH